MEKKKYYGNVKDNMDFNNTKIDWLQVDEVIKSLAKEDERGEDNSE